ncbi:MAG TPA: hypothetical protein VGA70_06480 [Longimicrobiales bacterium]|jgi:hypothetical protein
MPADASISGASQGAAMHAKGRPCQRGGFAVAFVVFLLFAVAVAGAIGYQVVRLEAELAYQSQEGGEALSVARAGLSRFAGESLGVPGDSVTYFIGNGEVLIRTRMLAVEDSVTDLYLIQSTATIENDLFPQSPASRTVSQYARLHKDPLGIHGALVTSSTIVQARSSAVLSGFDTSTSLDCSTGGIADVAGVVHMGLAIQTGGTIQGSPADSDFATYAAVYDSARVRWDVLQDPTFAIKHDGSPPNFAAIPSDSFPVVRATNDLNAGWSWSGRGVLIVPGAFGTGFGFQWNGVILAGSTGNIDGWLSRIDGMVISGLDGAEGLTRVRRTEIHYNNCDVMAAMESIAYLELLDQTWWEEY